MEPRSYYESTAEKDRLATGVGRLEFERTRDILRRHLPPAPAKILDVGGGPGAYSCWLARAGYEVHLIDPVPRHIEQARTASARQTSFPIAHIETGDARSLPVEDGTQDAVLLLGPLYHLVEPGDRLQALREARRVLTAGGLLVAAGISRFASLLDGLNRGFLDDPGFAAIVDRDLASGQHRNTTGNEQYFTTAFFHRPEELAAEAAEAGFESADVLAVEGPGWAAQDLERQLSQPERRAQLLRLLGEVESEPAMLGASYHLLAVARKAWP
jgi:ubiquinone/menaquinone biosynthesis C-methylase UbiE